MNLHLENRRILVTGAAQGLGLAIAKELASSGARVLLSDLNKKVQEHIEDPVFQGSARAVIADLAEPNGPFHVMEAAVREFGSVDGLVNCAAWSFHKELMKTTVPDFNNVVAVNLRSPFFLCQQFMAQLTDSAQDPCIVNIASVNALVGTPNLSAYAATKGALVAMTRALAVELSPRVRVISITPGSTLTDTTQQLIEQKKIDPVSLLSRNLIQRFISVNEVAEIVTFLFSSAARSVTGANWIVDAGLTS